MFLPVVHHSAVFQLRRVADIARVHGPVVVLQHETDNVPGQRAFPLPRPGGAGADELDIDGRRLAPGGPQPGVHVERRVDGSWSEKGC